MIQPPLLSTLFPYTTLFRSTEISINTHGMIDLGISDTSFLILSKEGDGRFTLTSRAIEQAHLEGRPLVLLARSEEHTSELQSLRHLVCRLLLEKKNERREQP